MITPEMRAAACAALNERGQGNTITIPDVNAMLSAALALVPGEPVGWRWKLPSDDFWQFKDGPERPRLGLPTKTEAAATIEPVYAAPVPQPVAVKALEWEALLNRADRYDQWKAYTIIGRYSISDVKTAFEWHWDGHGAVHREPSLVAAMSAIQAHFDAAIRSALVNPVPSDAEGLKVENGKMRKDFGKIADMLDSEDADLDDAIFIASAWREA